MGPDVTPESSILCRSPVLSLYILPLVRRRARPGEARACSCRTASESQGLFGHSRARWDLLESRPVAFELRVLELQINPIGIAAVVARKRRHVPVFRPVGLLIGGIEISPALHGLAHR